MCPLPAVILAGRGLTAPGAGDRWLLVWLFTPAPKADWRPASSTVIRRVHTAAPNLRRPLPPRPGPLAAPGAGHRLGRNRPPAKPAVLTGMPTATAERPQQIGHAQ